MTCTLQPIKGYAPEDSTLWNSTPGADNTAAIHDAMICAVADAVPCILSGKTYNATTISVPDGLILITFGTQINTISGATSYTPLLDLTNINELDHIGELCLQGGLSSPQSQTSTEGYYVGINIDGNSNYGNRIRFDHLRVRGMDKRGVAVARITTALHNKGPVFNRLDIEKCWRGFDSGNLAEGIRILSGSVNGCREGFRTTGGNCRYFIDIGDNWTGVLVEDNTNDNHSHFTGNITHNDIAIQCNNVERGFWFEGCHIVEGEVNLVNSRGIYITNGIIQNLTFNFDGGGPGAVFNNSEDDITSACVFNHNVNGNTSYITVSNNPVFRP